MSDKTSSDPMPFAPPEVEGLKWEEKPPRLGEAMQTYHAWVDMPGLGRLAVQYVHPDSYSDGMDLIIIWGYPGWLAPHFGARGGSACFRQGAQERLRDHLCAFEVLGLFLSAAEAMHDSFTRLGEGVGDEEEAVIEAGQIRNGARAWELVQKLQETRP